MFGKESEKNLESRLREAIEKRGGVALKFTSQYHRGMPDRFILMPHGLTYFVELKSTGRHPDPLQVRAHDMLRKLGFFVVVIDSGSSLAHFLWLVDYDQQIEASKL